MTKRAFDKIKAGLDDARAYLDGTADKRQFGVHLPARKTAVRAGRAGTRTFVKLTLKPRQQKPTIRRGK